MSYVTIPAHLVFSRKVPSKYRGIRIYLEALRHQDLGIDEIARLLKTSPSTVDRAKSCLRSVDALDGWPEDLQVFEPDAKYVPKTARPDFSQNRRGGGWFHRVPRQILAHGSPLSVLLYCVLMHKRLEYWSKSGAPSTSVTELSKILRTDKKAVRRHVRQAEEEGILTWNRGQFSLLSEADMDRRACSWRHRTLLSNQDKARLFKLGRPWLASLSQTEIDVKYSPLGGLSDVKYSPLMEAYTSDVSAGTAQGYVPNGSPFSGGNKDYRNQDYPATRGFRTFGREDQTRFDVPKDIDLDDLVRVVYVPEYCEHFYWWYMEQLRGVGIREDVQLSVDRGYVAIFNDLADMGRDLVLALISTCALAPTRNMSEVLDVVLDLVVRRSQRGRLTLDDVKMLLLSEGLTRAVVAWNDADDESGHYEALSVSTLAADPSRRYQQYVWAMGCHIDATAQAIDPGITVHHDYQKIRRSLINRLYTRSPLAATSLADIDWLEDFMVTGIEATLRPLRRAVGHSE